MNAWEWLWAWGRDPAVWEWLRPTAAALLGAFVGGLFTLWGQRQSASQQVAREEAESVKRRGEALRDQSREDAKLLFAEFTALHRAIQTSELSFGNHVDGHTWIPEWNDIWTRERSLDLDVRARLLTDPIIREQVQRLVEYLDRAPLYSDGGDGEFDSPLDTNLHYMVGQLSAEGVELLGAYLRGDSHATVRQRMWDDLAECDRAFVKWQEYVTARMEAQADDYEQEFLRRQAEERS
ncbi:MAG: hypothetical protein JSS88_06210 [Actinobacteria bacterium]|nr:hypothetical protein [Actinomycetota bacterium]